MTAFIYDACDEPMAFDCYPCVVQTLYQIPAQHLKWG